MTRTMLETLPSLPAISVLEWEEAGRLAAVAEVSLRGSPVTTLPEQGLLAPGSLPLEPEVPRFCASSTSCWDLLRAKGPLPINQSLSSLSQFRGAPTHKDIRLAVGKS